MEHIDELPAVKALICKVSSEDGKKPSYLLTIGVIVLGGDDWHKVGGT